MLTKKKQKVAIVMGSQSDYATMKYCKKVLKVLKIDHETRIVSAHRTPNRMYAFAKSAERKNISVIIAGAGGSAHLPGMLAALTRIPVLGVPMLSVTKGIDSLLSTVQMPAGVPVATLAIGKAGAINSALFATAILSRKYPKILKKLKEYRSNFEKKIPNKPY